MKCAIMQPTYLPWAGYFNLIKSVDVFVFLDDVQFERRSWQSRNRIIDNGRVQWLTCPTQKASRDTLIKDIQLLDDGYWQQQHIKKLRYNYAKAPFFSELQPFIDLLENANITSLAMLNAHLIEWLCQRLDINTMFVHASTLAATGDRSEHLLQICQTLGADTYLSPVGSAQYLDEDKVFDNSKINLSLQNYQPKTYFQQQSATRFISHLSIVDVIAHLGFSNTKRYIQGETVCKPLLSTMSA
jgi:hypothetical protein